MLSFLVGKRFSLRKFTLVQTSISASNKIFSRIGLLTSIVIVDEGSAFCVRWPKSPWKNVKEVCSVTTLDGILVIFFLTNMKRPTAYTNI